MAFDGYNPNALLLTHGEHRTHSKSLRNMNMNKLRTVNFWQAFQTEQTI